MSFIGNVPAEAYSPVAKDTFSGNGSTTDFTLSIPATTNSVEVFVENVQQEPTDAYTISGTTLSFTAAPVTGTNNIYVIHRGPAVQQVTPPAGVAIDASTITASSTLAVTGVTTLTDDLNVDSGTLFVDASADSVGIGTTSPSAPLHVLTTSIPQAKIAYDSTRYMNVEHATIYNVSGAAQSNNLKFATRGFSGNNNITFFTGGTDASGTSESERARIDSSGNLLVGTTDTAIYNNSGSGQGGASFSRAGAGNYYLQIARDAETSLFVNRLVNDGRLVDFRQDGSLEGDITVSGSTVSYNGGHLSRWSQSIDKTRIDELVKGTVLSNLDAMCEWKQVTFEYEILVSEAVESQDAVYQTVTKKEPYEGDASVSDVIDWEYEGETVQATVILEDNEQLNRMKVSDVEGDPNVAGVFVNWDDDDNVHTTDMNVAMTGDMVIRIAQGTTVQRGDLLMSAGDGTAKPQDDDIVRSKTIAKVTSTYVSHTYDDGSYLVPCVLMAC